MKNQAVWKYNLKVEDDQVLELPLNSKILSVQVQQGALEQAQICLWALVNTEEKKKENRVILMRGTGHSIIVVPGTKVKFIDTIQLRGGNIVFHLFERK